MNSNNMQKDKSTPEEKLLNLIENPTPKIKRQFKPPFRRGMPLKPSHLSRAIKELWLRKRVKILTLKFANRALIGLSVIATLFIVFDFIIGNKDIGSLYLIEKGLAHSMFKTDKVAEALPLSDYLDEVKRREIFTPIEQVLIAYEEEGVSAIVSLAETLVLVGILWSGTPQVMIEDTTSNKTYILNKGDTINDLTIKDIFRDKVILSYKDEEMVMM